MANLSDAQSGNLLVGIVTTVCTIVFSLFCWMVKLSVRRELARYDEQAKEADERYHEFCDHREYVITVLAYHQLLPRPVPPKAGLH